MGEISDYVVIIFVSMHQLENRAVVRWSEVKTGFTEGDQCKPVLLRLSLAGNLKKPLMSLYVTEWRERGYELKSDI